MMKWKEILVALVAAKSFACTAPNWDYRDPVQPDPTAEVDTLPEEPGVQGPLEIKLNDGESLGDNPHILTGDDWRALKSTDAATQLLEFAERSGVVGKTGEGTIMNFGGGSNLFKYALDFIDGLELQTKDATTADGFDVYFKNIHVNMIGEDYSLEKIEYNPTTSEMWIGLESMDRPGRRIRLYDNNVFSNAYSTRESEIDGTRQTNLDVTIEAYAKPGGHPVIVRRVKVRNQIHPSKNINIRPCMSASAYIPPESLLSDGFDIVNKGESGCEYQASENTLVADTISIK
ncbi:hypothetical protein ACFL3V_03350 [Nanoarchaeota archaeon]